MGDIQRLTVYYRAAYLIAGVVYGAYIVSLVIRARRAMAKLEAATQR